MTKLHTRSEVIAIFQNKTKLEEVLPVGLDIYDIGIRITDARRGIETQCGGGSSPRRFVEVHLDCGCSQAMSDVKLMHLIFRNRAICHRHPTGKTRPDHAPTH